MKNKHLSKVLMLLLAFSLLLTGCGSKKEDVVESPVVEEVEGVETGEKFVEVEHTDAFSIEYLEDDVKLVKDAENQEFLLVPRGQDAPSGHDDAVVINTPVENALFFSSTQVSMLRPLGVWDSIGGVTQDKGQWGSMEEIDKGIEDGSIKFVGGSMEPDYEMIQELNPEIAFVYTGSSPQTDIINKLEDLGIPYAVDNEYMEQKHTGRMEWIKFLGTFFDKDEEAKLYVDRQIEDLEEMKSKIEGEEAPKVAWGMVYDGVVYVPGKDSYVAEAVREAGGDYLFSHIEGTGSSQISLEEFYAVLEDADYWIYSSSAAYVPDFEALLELAPVVEDTKVVQDGNVWLFGLDYYNDTDKSDEQVIDLAAIFHNDIFGDYEISHYEKLSK